CGHDRLGRTRAAAPRPKRRARCAGAAALAARRDRSSGPRRVSGSASTPIGVIGGGAWGTALGLVALRAGSPALLWVREADLVPAINERHENHLFLEGVPLDPALRATDRLAEAAASDLLLLVVPAQHLAAVARDLEPHLKDDAVLVSCAKG